MGDVIRQDIPSGSLVDKGTEISITISLGEEETYHYEGIISLSTSPFAEGQTGSLEIVVEQGERQDVIYTNDSISSQAFPLNVDYTSPDGEEAIATIYVNGEKYNTINIDLSAVAD